MPGTVLGAGERAENRKERENTNEEVVSFQGSPVKETKQGNGVKSGGRMKRLF